MRSLFSYLQKKNCENDEKVMPLFIQRIFKMVLRLHVMSLKNPAVRKHWKNKEFTVTKIVFPSNQLFSARGLFSKCVAFTKCLPKNRKFNFPQCTVFQD